MFDDTERNDELATDADWDRLDAQQRSEENPDKEYVLTDRDVWHRNPFYTGAPGPHPDDYEQETDDANEPPNYPTTWEQAMNWTRPGTFDDDDLPF